MLHSTFYHQNIEEKVQNQRNDYLNELEGLKLNTFKSKMKKDEFFLKYGGIRFVQRFVAEMFNRLSTCGAFKKICSNLDHPRMVWILKGFIKLFKFDYSVKDFRNDYQKLGFEKHHFNQYAATFEDVGKYLNIDKNDIAVLLQEFKKMIAMISLKIK